MTMSPKTISGCCYKICVHADAVFVRVQMYPIRLDVRHAVALLQKDNVAGDFGTGIAA
jgi:hypothetical protein